MGKAVVIMVDGGFLHKTILKCEKKQPDDSDDYVELIKKYINSVASDDEEVMRILFYDCYPYKPNKRNATEILPILKTRKRFSKKTSPLTKLGQSELIALRLGRLRLRGFRNVAESEDLKDESFKPIFEQKAVDVKIAVDMVVYSLHKLISRITLISNDTDLIPAMKEARRNGIQIKTVSYNGYNLNEQVIKHSDFVKKVDFTQENRLVSAAERR